MSEKPTFTAKPASDIRFRVGIFLGSQYGYTGRRKHGEPPFRVLGNLEGSHVSVFRTYPGNRSGSPPIDFLYAVFLFFLYLGGVSLGSLS